MRSRVATFRKMNREQFFPITSVLWLNGFVEPVPRNGVVIVTATYPCQQKTPQKTHIRFCVN
jgi:hypothetical protein